MNFGSTFINFLQTKIFEEVYSPGDIIFDVRKVEMEVEVEFEF